MKIPFLRFTNEEKLTLRLLCSAVIKEFGKNIGAEQKQVQGLIRLAKQNGEKLGFLS